MPVGSDEPIGYLENEIEYYTGRDAEGSWSEGSQSGSSYAKAPPSGEFRIVVEADAPSLMALRVRISARDRLTRWPMLVAFGMFLPGLFIKLRQAGFEGLRWGANEED